jgi:hypothetical protein
VPKMANFFGPLKPSRSAQRRFDERAFLNGRAEVARAQTTTSPNLTIVASASLQKPQARRRGCRIDTRMMAHFREIGHYRAFMAPTLIRNSTRPVETWSAPRAHVVAIYYNAVFLKKRKRKPYNPSENLV